MIKRVFPFVLTWVVASSFVPQVTVQLNGQPAIVDTRTVYTSLGKSAVISCELPGGTKQLDQCLWWVHSKLNGSFSSATHLVVNYNREIENSVKPNYELDLEGLHAGKCQVRIANVAKNDIGDWNCTLINKAYGTFNGHLEVIEYVSPSFSPQIKSAEGLNGMTVNVKNTDVNRRNITCCVVTKDAIPEPDIVFQIIGPSGIIVTRSNGTRTISETAVISSEPKSLCKTWINAAVNYTWNGKDLECILTHPAFEDDGQQIRKDSMRLEIFYLPVIIGASSLNKNIVIVTKPTVEVHLSTAVMGNPLPVVTWEALGKSYNSKNSGGGNPMVIETVKNDTIISEIIFDDIGPLETNPEVVIEARGHGNVERVVYELIFEEETGKGFSFTIYMVLFAAMAVLIVASILVFIVYKVRRANVTGGMDLAVELRLESPARENFRALRKHNRGGNRAVGESRADEHEVEPVISGPMPISKLAKKEEREERDGSAV